MSNMDELRRRFNLLPSAGHIRRVYIRNFMQFQGSQTVELSHGESPSVVAFIGASGTGKTRVMECIANINILRHQYKVAENSKLKLKRVGKGPSPLDCDEICTKRSCDESFTKQPYMDQWFIEHGVHYCDITKTNKAEDSIFAVETRRESKHPVYYGLYAREDEDKWYWHYRDKDETYRYSTLFVVDTFHDHNEFYVLRPTVDQPNKDIELSKFCSKNLGRRDFWSSVEEPLRNYLSADINNSESLSRLPEELEILLPSSHLSLAFQYHVSTRITEDECFYDYMPQSPALCFLMDNPLCKSHNSDSAENRLKSLEEKCMKHKLQIIMTVYNESADLVNKSSFTNVVRFWEDRAGGRWAAKVPNDLLKAFRKNPYCNAYAVLTSNTTLIVEGASDVNVLKEVFTSYTNTRGKAPGPQKQEKVDENTRRLLKVLGQIHLTQCEGKEKFPGQVKLFLPYVGLGLCHSIVCDGDALIGGKAKDMKDTKKKTGEELMSFIEEKSPILQASKDSVLKEYITYILKDRRNSLPPAFRPLLDAKCNGKTVCELKSSKPRDLITGLIQDNCKDYETTRTFAKSTLQTFAWGAENCDLESVIRVTDPSFKGSKSFLAKNTKAVRKIAEDILKKNDEIQRLFTFIISVCSNTTYHYTPVENKPEHELGWKSLLFAILPVLLVIGVVVFLSYCC